MQLLDRNISRIFLIDDNPGVRATYSLLVEDIGLEPVDVSNRIENIQEFSASIDPMTDGVICDYQLTTRKYSVVNGDILVSSLFENKVAAILCSRFTDVKSNVRNLRRKIPAIASPKDFSSENIIEGLLTCIKEHSGQINEERKMWKTLVRIEAAESKNDNSANFHIIIPAWNENEGIEVNVALNEKPIFREMFDAVSTGNVFRAKALVNIGASSIDEIFLDDWEHA